VRRDCEQVGGSQPGLGFGNPSKGAPGLEYKCSQEEKGVFLLLEDGSATPQQSQDGDLGFAGAEDV